MESSDSNRKLNQQMDKLPPPLSSKVTLQEAKHFSHSNRSLSMFDRNHAPKSSSFRQESSPNLYRPWLDNTTNRPPLPQHESPFQHDHQRQHCPATRQPSSSSSPSSSFLSRSLPESNLFYNQTTYYKPRSSSMSFSNANSPKLSNRQHRRVQDSLPYSVSSPKSSSPNRKDSNYYPNSSKMLPTPSFKPNSPFGPRKLSKLSIFHNQTEDYYQSVMDLSAKASKLTSSVSSSALSSSSNTQKYSFKQYSNPPQVKLHLPSSSKQQPINDEVIICSKMAQLGWNNPYCSSTTLSRIASPNNPDPHLLSPGKRSKEASRTPSPNEKNKSTNALYKLGDVIDRIFYEAFD